MSLPITDVGIATSKAATTRAGFSVPLFITATVPDGVGEPFENNVTQIYTSLTGMTDAGFATTDPAYIAAQGFLSYKGNVPQKWIIGKHDTEVGGYVDSLIAAETETTEFYAFMSDSHALNDVQDLRIAASVREKLYLFSTQEDGSKDLPLDQASDTAGIVTLSNASNTVGFFSSTADTTFPECRFWSAGAAYYPEIANIVWYYKKIDGVAAETLTDSQRANLDARNLNYVLSGRDLGISSSEVRTVGGKTTNGKWIHEIRLVHNVDARITEDINAYLTLDNPFAPATVTGVNSRVGKALNPFVDVGSIKRYIVDDSNATLENGSYTGLRFTMYAKDFIVNVTINGLLTEEEEV